MFVVDTNLLIYAVTPDLAEHRAARLWLQKWRGSSRSWFATWSIVYEFLRVATHRAVLSQPLTFPQAWSFIEALRASPSFGLLTETDRHAETVRLLTTEYPHIAGNRIHDLHIAALMREHGITEIQTADTDFHQFKFLRVVNPLLIRRP